jgi:hypothetical protein
MAATTVLGFGFAMSEDRASRRRHR